jgi:hypothetical protein
MSDEIKRANARQNHGRGPCGQQCNPTLEMCQAKVAFYRDQVEVSGSTMSESMCQLVLLFWMDQLARAEARLASEILQPVPVDVD